MHSEQRSNAKFIARALRNACAQDPAGPFALQPGVIGLDSVGGDYHRSGDMNVFVDAEGAGDGYIIFTSGYKAPVSPATAIDEWPPIVPAVCNALARYSCDHCMLLLIIS